MWCPGVVEDGMGAIRARVLRTTDVIAPPFRANVLNPTFTSHIHHPTASILVDPGVSPKLAPAERESKSLPPPPS